MNECITRYDLIPFLTLTLGFLMSLVYILHDHNRRMRKIDRYYEKNR